MTVRPTKYGEVSCAETVCPWRVIECRSPENCKVFDDGVAIAKKLGTCQIMSYKCNRLIRFNRGKG
jgi:hypothetical protein